jgi:hypothetical protein
MVEYCSSCREDKGRHTLRGSHSSSHDSRRRYLNKEHKSIILGGVCLMYLQHYIRVISLVQKGRDYSEEVQRHSDRGAAQGEFKQGEQSQDENDTFSINDKGGEIYHMQRTEAWFQGEHE